MKLIINRAKQPISAQIKGQKRGDENAIVRTLLLCGYVI
ncbi:hypothetical protein MRBBS_3200 [Marinobacter sp. BSs20148]|nr:hypothetical protein MRBBS_3200 [Marinobacter sp. BSs20148]